MAITLNHFEEDTCKFMLSAFAEIEYEENQFYNFSLQIVNSKNKNTLSYKDTILENGKGSVEINFDHSTYMEDGISINVTATITKLPSPDPQPAPASSIETESAAANTKNIIIETKSQMYRLFGLYNCLDHIDFQQSCSYRYRQQEASLTSQPLKALATIFLQEDYRLISIVDDSVKLTYISSPSKPIKWDIDIINTLIILENNDQAPTCVFSRFCFEATALILHKPSNLILRLPLTIGNR